jgi:hypothetical protein
VFDLVRHAVRIQRQYVAVLRKKMQDILYCNIRYFTKLWHFIFMIFMIYSETPI